MSRRFVRCIESGVEYRVQSQSRWREAGPNLRASLEISISNPRCTGRFLECQLAWARRHFDSFEFSLGDTLRVHNYTTIGHPLHGRLLPEAAWRVAREEGDRWLESNGAVIQRMLATAPYAVVRWDDWKRDRGFAPRFRHLRGAYDAH